MYVEINPTKLCCTKTTAVIILIILKRKPRTLRERPARRRCTFKASPKLKFN